MLISGALEILCVLCHLNLTLMIKIWCSKRTLPMYILLGTLSTNMRLKYHSQRVRSSIYLEFYEMEIKTKLKQSARECTYYIYGRSYEASYNFRRQEICDKWIDTFILKKIFWISMVPIIVKWFQNNMYFVIFII